MQAKKNKFSEEDVKIAHNFNSDVGKLKLLVPQLKRITECRVEQWDHLDNRIASMTTKLKKTQLIKQWEDSNKVCKARIKNNKVWYSEWMAKSKKPATVLFSPPPSKYVAGFPPRKGLFFCTWQ